MRINWVTIVLCTLFFSGCAPTVKVEAPDKPIVINLNVKIQHEIKVHISELANERVAKVTDIVKEGEEIDVKVLEVDGRGRIRLSRKALL